MVNWRFESKTLAVAVFLFLKQRNRSTDIYVYVFLTNSTHKNLKYLYNFLAKIQANQINRTLPKATNGDIKNK